MKQFFKMFFASLLAVIVASVIVVGVSIGLMVGALKSMKTARTTVRTPQSASILVLKTSQRLREQGENNSLGPFAGTASYSPGLSEVVDALQKAKSDDKIKAVLLRLDGGSNGWATMQQLRQALLDFKAGGKKIFAYGDGISQRDYYLASAADVVYLNPTGVMELKGLVSQLSFIKGTLDKLGIQPEIFYAGKFKSATEPFRETKMTEANRLQLSELQRGIWNSFLNAAAAKAHTDTAAIYALARDGGLFFADRAVRAHLVDGAKYWDEMEETMRPLVDKKKDDKLPYVSMADYANHVDEHGPSDARIAVLFAEGAIVDGQGKEYEIGSESLVRYIRKIAREDKIKAVVLRVNSPGGSALASEVILRELQLLKAKKPLIVSMGDVAASGGYYIASGADSIFAMPTTITGSIGVFGMMFNVGDALSNKLGVTFDEVKNAPYADFPTGRRALTPEEKMLMQGIVDTIYSTFKSRVMAGRHLGATWVDSIAQGRVWSGTDAKKIGLVDDLGGIDRALRAAAAKAKLKDYRVETYPEPVDRLQALLRRFSNGPLSEAAVREAVSRSIQQELPAFRQVQWLLRMNGKAQMMLPAVPEFY
jgi:protease-4